MATTPTLSALDTDDWLGYGAYADALWSRIQIALIKSEGANAKLGDDPLVIGVFGEWGAGKSKLLSLMQDRSGAWANKRIGWRKRDGGSFGLTVPVYFQPWKYEHEEHLHVPILLHIFAALKRELESAQTWDEWANGKVPHWITEHLDKVVSAFGMCLAGAAVALDLTVPLSSRAGIATAGFLAKVLPKTKAKAQSTNPAETLQYSDSGRYFYEIHETLKAITRPYQHGKLLQGVTIQADLPINFVIFIDDLDRCLPEKAVQTLELIKTIFNAESFAFVLALDDEVIERGIGHRYKDYELQNKKPSMPITGFEYLEKIVHLPFRLPALTVGQARNFIQRLESEIAGKKVHWFKALEDMNPNSLAKLPFDGANTVPRYPRSAAEFARRGIGRFQETFDLLELALSGFDAFVPRKLSRMVELWHATVQVAQLRNDGDKRKEPLAHSTAAQVDIRIAFTLMMVQLFHPDLYRVLRRHKETFRTLFDGFDGTGENLTPNKSDIDLWHWAAYVEKVPKRPISFDETLAVISMLADDKRYDAQQKRLPLVDCLVAHRKVQRHVFDALKLLGTLKQHMPALPQDFAIGQYFSMLAQYDETLTPPRQARTKDAPVTEWSSADTVGTASVSRFSPIDPQQLYLSLIAADAGTQEALPETAQLEEGKFLNKEAVVQLTERVHTWLAEVANAPQDLLRRRVQLLNGLRHLAPYLAPGDRSEWWNVVKESVDISKDVDPKLRALWGDVRSLLGCDDRFDAERPYLFKTRFNDNQPDEEPLPGFLHIPAGDFQMGSKEDKDNPPRTVTIDKPFYISRTLVTVRQYTKFIEAGGYGDSKNWWDKQGVDWRNGAFDSKVENEGYKKWLARRSVGLRQQPMRWADQEKLASRPVWGVNWFEARAYARWLDAELRKDIEAAELEGAYKIMLPTDVQWERAARASSKTGADSRRWPWGDDENLADQQANLNQKVGSVSAVGLYPPNPVGLYDMAGNVWEWMDNLYSSKPDNMTGVKKDVDLMSEKTLGKSDQPMQRGGSWINDPYLACCSLRNRIQPDNWDNDLGFRVVLSLAD